MMKSFHAQRAFHKKEKEYGGQSFSRVIYWICGENHINDYIDPTGHSYENNEFVCDNCGFVNYPYGDISGDLEVNIIDLVRLKKILVGIAEFSGYPADLDKSGDVSAIDLTILRKLLLSTF